MNSNIAGKYMCVRWVFVWGGGSEGREVFPGVTYPMVEKVPYFSLGKMVSP